MRLPSRTEQATATALLERVDDVDPQLSDDEPELVQEDETGPANDDGSESGTDSAGGGEKRRWRPKLTTLLAGVAILVTVTLMVASGYMLWFHQQVTREQQHRTEFAAAASQAVVTLMSIDSAKAADNVKQIVDNATGQFRDDIQSSAADLVKTAQESKATTKATVRASAVQSMDADSAVVLISAATTVSNSAGADQQPRNWRLCLTMVKDGGQIKMSKVEFVP